MAGRSLVTTLEKDARATRPGIRGAVDRMFSGRQGKGIGIPTDSISAGWASYGPGGGPFYRTGPRRLAQLATAYGGTNDSVTWVFACTSLIASTAASYPYHFRDLLNKELEKPPVELMRLLQQPNPDQTYFDFVEAVMTDLELVGNSYWLKDQRNGYGQPLELRRLIPEQVKIAVAPDGREMGYLFQTSGPTSIIIPYDGDEVIHFKYPNPLDEHYGMGTVEALARALDQEIAQSLHVTGFFQNGARISGVLTVPETLSETQFQRIKHQFTEEYAGAPNAFKVMVAEGSAAGGAPDFKPISQGPAAIGVVDLRKLSKDEILSGFGIPEFLMGGAGQAGVYKMEEAQHIFLRGMVPKTIRYSERVTNDLCRLWGEMKFVTEPYASEPLSIKIEHAKGMMGTGASLNQCLQAQGLPLIDSDAANSPLIPANLITIDQSFARPAEILAVNLPPGGRPMLPDGGGTPVPAPANSIVGSNTAAGAETRAAPEGVGSQGKAWIPPTLPSGWEGPTRSSQSQIPDGLFQAMSQHQARVLVKATPLVERAVAKFFTEQRIRVFADLATYGPVSKKSRAGRLSGAPTREKAALTPDALWHSAEEDKALRDAYLPLVDQVGTMTLHDMPKVTGVALDWNISHPLIDTARSRLADKVVRINDTTRAQLGDAVSTGLARGYSVVQIANGVAAEKYGGVLGVFDTAVHSRAETIARTETAYMYNAATIAGYRDAGVEQVEVMDGEDDEECAAANGETWTVDQADEDDLAHPNCIRSFAPIVTEDTTPVDETLPPDDGVPSDGVTTFDTGALDLQAAIGAMQDSAGALNDVFSIDANLPIVQLPNSDAATARLLNRDTGPQIGIHQDSSPSTLTNSVVHEFGHYIDRYILGDGSDFGNYGDSLYRTMRDSPTMVAVRNDEFQVLQGDTQTRNYILQGREMFARAVHQYTAERAQSPVLRTELERIQNDKYLSFQFWQPKEFEPIAAQLDKLFSDKGVLRTAHEIPPNGDGATLTVDDIRAMNLSYEDSLVLQVLEAQNADTQALYSALDSEGRRVYDEQRHEAVHVPIVNQALADGAPVESPRSLFLAGGPASGKSSVLDSGVVKAPEHAVTVNADLVKERMPEYRAGVQAGNEKAAALTHEESADIASAIRHAAEERHMNSVIDGVGDSGEGKFLSKLQVAHDAGREVSVVLVDVPTKKALERAASRAAHTGRAVPADTIREAHTSVAARFLEYRDVRWVDWKVYSNDVPKGKDPVLIAEKAKNGEIVVHDRKLYDAFTLKGEPALVQDARRALEGFEQPYPTSGGGSAIDQAIALRGAVDRAAANNERMISAGRAIDRAVRAREGVLREQLSTQLTELRALKEGYWTGDTHMTFNEYKKLNGKIADLFRKQQTVQQDSVTAVVSQLREMGGRMELGTVDAKGVVRQMRAQAQAVAKHMPTEWLRGSNEADKALNITRVSDRAKYVPSTGTINVRLADPSTMTHEFLHRVEETQGLNFKAHERAFYEKRTAGEEARRLRDLTGNPEFRDSEIAREDQFVNPYFGKDYGGYFYELASMASQSALYGDFGALAGDLETLYWFLGMMARA